MHSNNGSLLRSKTYEIYRNITVNGRHIYSDAMSIMNIRLAKRLNVVIH